MSLTLSLDSFLQDRLPDGDHIDLVIAGSAPSDQVRLALRTQPGMWKKRMVLHHDGQEQTLEAESDMTTSSLTLGRSQFPAAKLVLWKAKAFGEMKPIYELAGPELSSLLGKSIVWDWRRD